MSCRPQRPSDRFDAERRAELEEMEQLAAQALI
jgi:hypothetical protein